MSKTYLLTGATSGMGKAIYADLTQKGHTVIPVLRNKEQAQNFAPTPSTFIEADLANSGQIEAAFSDLKTPLDGFINAAGILPGDSFEETDAAKLTELFNINTISPMLITKAIKPLLNQGACIILFGSISGHKGSYDDGYAASKGAVHSLVRSLALKFAPHARVIGIAPGMTENTRMTNDLVEGRFEHNMKLIPLQQAGQPTDIAELTSFVLSDTCQFMTGCVIDINGGQYLRT